MRSPSARHLVAALFMVLTTAAGPAVAQQFDPRYRFQTIRTDHFAIHFHQGAEAMATSLAAIAEETWRRFTARPGSRVPPMTHVVLADQSESANGFASPWPRNTIVLYASAPPPAGLLNPDDWLRALFVHEYTHIVHLDRGEGWARLARGLFGRAPWTFPNLLLPLWHIEGLATFEESVATPGGQSGRLHAGDFQALTREAARVGSLEPIDRVSGGLTDWPGGLSPYAYGLAFHDWLARRHGPETFEALSAATARSLPWLGTRAFRGVYDRSLRQLWSDFAAEYQTAAQAGAGDAADTTAARRITTHGFQVSGPRYLPRACAACPIEIAYTLRTPHDRPGLHVVRPDTGATHRVTTRFLGSTTSVSRDGRLYFDQQERHRNAGLYADLYVFARDTGRVTRLTTDARLMDPDLSPDERVIAAVRHEAPGRRDLVLVETGHDATPRAPTIARLASADGTQFNAPRWSPDGRRIVASRQPPTGPADIVIVDVETRRLDVLTGNSGMRWATPTWRPDGRAIVASGARGDDAFDLYEIALDTGAIRRITRHHGGAIWPDVAADAGTIVYVGYGIEGFDLYEIPYIAGGDGAGRAATRPAPAPQDAADAITVAEAAATTYRPWSTILPTFWTPIVTASTEQVRAGAIVSGSDVLGYHLWNASVAWPIVDRVTTGPAGDQADWSAAYVYGRWRPRVWTAVTRKTSFFAADPDVAGLIQPSTFVEDVTEAGVQVLVQRLRFSQTTQVSVVRAVDTFTHMHDTRRRNRSGIRAAWRASTAQFPAYGISPERGVTAGAATEFVQPAFGASGRGGTLTADVRAYARGLARHHVVALRAVRGLTWGDAGVGRLFALGGGAASPGPGTLSSESGRLLRGFPTNTFVGRQLATVHVDYRFPLARPQRGLGTWPFFLHTLHGAVVADAGHAWSGAFDRRDVKWSIGLELSADLVLGYGLPLTVTGGVARGHDGAGHAPSRTTTYARVGYAF